MKIQFNNIFILPLLFLFFPAFCIWVSVKPIVIYYLAVTVAFIFTIMFKPKTLIKKVKLLYKISALKYYLIFSLWCIISGIILIILGEYKISVFLYYSITLLLICYSFTYILPALVYNSEKYNIRFFIKLLTIIYYIIFCIAFIEFWGRLFDNRVLTFLSDFLGNQRTLVEGYIECGRVRSIFAEPGWLGAFIFTNMPIIYSMILSKYKIFKNNIFELMIKYTMIPLMWITIVIEQSAIWLVLNALLSLFYFRKTILYMIKRYAVIIVPLIIIGARGIFYLLSPDSGFNIGLYDRIFSFFQNITSFEKLVENNQSLGCRLVSYVLSVKVGLENWLLGVGLGNLQYKMPRFFYFSNLPEVKALLFNFQNGYMEERMNFNGAIPYEYFAELGIIGICTFYYFIYRTVKLFKKLKNYFVGIEYAFANGLYFSLCALPIIFFYDITISYYYAWFLFGLSNIFILNLYYRRGQNIDTKNFSNNTGV